MGVGDPAQVLTLVYLVLPTEPYPQSSIDFLNNSKTSGVSIAPSLLAVVRTVRSIFQFPDFLDSGEQSRCS